MTDTLSSPVLFNDLPNFRDVAELANDSHPLPRIKKGLLFRSARPDATTTEDRDKLIHQYKVQTIIDLRTKTEHINAAKKHSDAFILAQSAAIPVSDDVTATPLKIPGIQYAEINLNGKGFERSLIWQLKYTSLAKLIGLMALGYRMEAISILGREVLLKRGLIGLGIDTLEHSGQEIKEVFNVLSQKQSWPVIVHCTQGKDRTGLIVVLVLLLCGIGLEAVTRDYIQSEVELKPEFEERMKEISNIGLDESFAKCPNDFVYQIDKHIRDKYSNCEGYIRHIGVTGSQIQQIRSILLQKI